MKQKQQNNPVVIAVLVLILVGSLVKSAMTLMGSGTPSSPVPPPEGTGKDLGNSAAVAQSPNNTGSTGQTGANGGGFRLVPAVERETPDPFYHPLLKKLAQSGNALGNGAKPGQSAGGVVPNERNFWRTRRVRTQAREVCLRSASPRLKRVASSI